MNWERRFSVGFLIRVCVLPTEVIFFFLAFYLILSALFIILLDRGLNTFFLLQGRDVQITSFISLFRPKNILSTYSHLFALSELCGAVFKYETV